MTITITQHLTKRNQWRYDLTQDGVSTHLLNSASLEWHLTNKLGLTVEQGQQVFNEICYNGTVILELVPQTKAS